MKIVGYLLLALVAIGLLGPFSILVVILIAIVAGRRRT